jgi:uncharacterized protein (UPF0216 family)
MATFADKKVIIKTIQTLNQHLPSRRRTLMELLSDERPGVKGKDNTFYVIDKGELELISKELPRFLWSRIRLPLLIEMSPDFGSGASRIQGEVECELVSKLLKRSNEIGRRSMVIYMPEVREIRRLLPTASQYAFVTSLKDEDAQRDF